MALREGEIYRCPDRACGCEVTVTRSAPDGCPGEQNPTCCSGHTMEKVSN